MMKLARRSRPASANWRNENRMTSIADFRRVAPASVWRRIRRYLTLELFLGALSLCTVALLWEFARPLGIPVLSNLPPLSEIVRTSEQLLRSNLYWDGWLLSVRRITAGFLLAQVVGVPIGLLLALHRASFETTFPIVEILRPIPP